MSLSQMWAVCCDFKKCLEHDFHFTYLGTKIFLRELILYNAEFKSEKFPLRRSAVFSQTSILSSLIYDKFFHCSTTWMDEDTRLHN